MFKSNDIVQGPPELAARSTGLKVSRLIHNIDDDTFEFEVEFNSITGQRKSIRLPRSTRSYPSDILKKLLDSGANLPSEKGEVLEAVRKALEDEPKEHLQVTRRGGWHGRSFIRRNWTAGDNQALRLVGASDANNPMDARSGNLSGWMDGLKKPCERSTYLSFGIGVSFAAPLLGLIGEDEGAMFNFYGRSSSGKSLTCRASQSVFARAAKNEMPTYDITDRALEELCFERCDLTVVFDEEGRAKGGAEQRHTRSRNIAFTVAGGQGMARSKIVSQTRELSNLKWRVLGLTSSEVPLEAGSSRSRVDGERVRHIDIAIPGDERGIFDHLKPENASKAPIAAKLVEDTIRDHHGVALKPYIKALLQEIDRVPEQVNAAIDAFLNDLKIGADPWERRFARKFALVSAGMLLASKYGVAPWTENHARRSVRKIYRTARKSVFTVQERAQELIETLREALEDDYRFPNLAKGEELPAH